MMVVSFIQTFSLLSASIHGLRNDAIIKPNCYQPADTYIRPSTAASIEGKT